MGAGSETACFTGTMIPVVLDYIHNDSEYWFTTRGNIGSREDLDATHLEIVDKDGIRYKARVV
jgi:hypothetical protein